MNVTLHPYFSSVSSAYLDRKCHTAHAGEGAQRRRENHSLVNSMPMVVVIYPIQSMCPLIFVIFTFLNVPQ